METQHVTIRMPADLLRRIDRWADVVHNTRTGAITFLCAEGLRSMADFLTAAERAADRIKESR